MKRLTMSAAILATLLGTTGAIAAEGNWLVRGRVVYIDTADKSDAVPALAVPADAVHVSTKTIPEVDITYFFSKNLAAELILTYPQKHDVSVTASALGNLGKIGTIKHLPPTLTLQYHFMPEATIRPYVGAGINYTRISDVDLQIAGVGRLDLDNNSWGPAIQAGVDVQLAKDMYLNFDIKKVQLRTDLKLGGTKISELKLDPYLLGVGIGWRF